MARRFCFCFHPSRKLPPVPGRRAVSLLSLSAFTCLLFAAEVQAQYRFDQWTTENGLPQNSVSAILQTRDGYLWLTTFDGLVRFDGVRFTVFNKSNSPGLISNRFVHLYEDRFGDLWVAMEAGGLVRRHQGRFITYTSTEGGAIDCWLDGDADGNLLISSVSRYFRWREGGFQPAADYRPPASQLPSGWPPRGFSKPALVRGNHLPLQAVSRDAAGSLWLTDLGTGQRQLMSQRPPEGLEYHTVFADNEGNYWFLTKYSGFFRARRQTLTAYAKAQGLNVREVYPLLETRDGALWIGASGDGLWRLKDGAFTRYATKDLVNSLYEDRAGRLWVNGSSRMEGGRLIRDVWGKSSASALLTNTWAMCEDQQGSFWIAPIGGGVARYYGESLLAFYKTKDGLAGDDTKVIIPDVSEEGLGGVWLGSYGGLTHYTNGKFTAWTEKDGLPGNTVRALYQDQDGTLWIGTYDSGLGRYKNGRFTRYTQKDGLFDNGVFQILEDDFGWLWMSCNRGLYRVRKQDLNAFAEGTLKTLTSLSYNRGDGMPSSECNGGSSPAGVKARDGRLWFPTMGGVAVVDPSAMRTNPEPPPVVIEAVRIENQGVANEAMEAATAGSAGSRSVIEIRPGQTYFEVDYTAPSFINSENLRFKYKLEGADKEWVEAGTRRTAYYSRVSPGQYVFRVIAANADGVWNEVGASLRLTVVPPFYQRWWFLTLASLGVIGGVLLIFRMREQKLRREHARQAAFSRQLIESQEQERQRIAGELHDSLGQDLLIIKNRALLGLEPSPEASADWRGEREQLLQISELSSQALDGVREIAYNLRPYQIDRIGLTKAIEFMVRKVAETSTIRFVREIDRMDGCLAPDAEINLYRIVQESVNNILRHSNATEARLRLYRDDRRVSLVIEDNGRGFSPEASASEARRGGFGLTGMAERARMLGGRLTVRSASKQGTVIEVTINLQDGNNANGDSHRHRR
jgi:signal transduction histidine kinase/ligand-binding sensor domain-containing protein